MRFETLGPLSVLSNGETLSLGGRKQRTLLAVLLLRRNEVVARDHLVDALWGERPPRSAVESLDTYVYRLRKLLGHDRLAHEAGGYLLRVEPGELDVDEFERLVADADVATESGDYQAAVSELTVALALWHGPAWGELLDDPLISLEAQRLEELRLSAIESRIEAQLATGGGSELVAELEQLVVEHPLRERLQACLMLALYRAGRQTEALEAFQAARLRLVEELGLEPGPGLQELQRRILEHDPTLAAPSRFPPLPRSRAGRQRSLAVLVALVALVAGVFLLSSGAGGEQALAAGASGVVAVQTASSRVTVATQLAGTPGAVASGAGAVWVADPGIAAVWRVDPESGGESDRILVGGEPGSITYGDGAVWVASTTRSTVTRIDPTTGHLAAPIHLPGTNPVAIAYGAHRVWVADSVERELFEIDPANDALKRTWQLDLQPSAITSGDGAVWIAGYNDATVEKLDPASGKVIGRVHVGDGPVALAFAFGSLWVANSLDSTVSRVNPTTLKVTAPIAVGSGPAALAAGRGAVWVANQYSGTVSRIAPRSDRVRASVAVGGTPTSLTASGGRLWVGVAANPGSHRGGTLTIVTTQKFSTTSNEISSIDPAFYDEAGPPQFMGLAYDSLLTLQQTPGAAGLRLVPDLALSIPTASDGGKTYTFRIRPGIRYSDGQPLRPDDFRRAIERLFAVSSPGASSFDDLVGVTCPPIPGHCPGIVTDDRTGTVTFHLTAPDSGFLYALAQSYAAPIPPGTPDLETGSHTVPGTGPYKIVSISTTKIRFVRNPFFHEWSHAAQPDGNPNSILWRALPSTHDAVTAIEQGRADWLFGKIPPHVYHQLELQDPAQLHSNPQPIVDYAGFDTEIPPFNDVRVRQALNYAIDRNKIVQLYGGPSLATPTCQPIAPLLPGYKRYCPYTLHPNTKGAYSGPDMTRARQLVAESGTRGETINLLGNPDINVPPTVPLYFASVLRSLGYRVHTHLVPFDQIMQLGVAPQIAVNGDILPGYPLAPSSYIPSFLGCAGGNPGGNNWGDYCNPAVDREIPQAQRLDLTKPPKARAIWETIDRQLTNTAAWVPTVTYPEIELTSRRLHNYQYNPVWGFLSDQSWIH